MECPDSDQWRVKLFAEDPANWPPGTDGLVATIIRQRILMAEAREFMDEYADDLTALSKL
jgi:hypothetical protein